MIERQNGRESHKFQFAGRMVEQKAGGKSTLYHLKTEKPAGVSARRELEVNCFIHR